jgi:hypothetical protein
MKICKAARFVAVNGSHATWSDDPSISCSPSCSPAGDGNDYAIEIDLFHRASYHLPQNSPETLQVWHFTRQARGSNPQGTEFINQFSVPLERTYGWRINLLTSLTCEFALSQILNTICRDKAGITTSRI